MSIERYLDISFSLFSIFFFRQFFSPLSFSEKDRHKLLNIEGKRAKYTEYGNMGHVLMDVAVRWVSFHGIGASYKGRLRRWNGRCSPEHRAWGADGIRSLDGHKAEIIK